MAEKRGDYAYMVEWLATVGLKPDTRMVNMVNDYWGWYVADNGFYHYRQRKGLRIVKLERKTLRPAAFVGNAWADLLMTEGCSISSDDERMQAIVDVVFSGFFQDQADFVARAFSLGTGGWALNLKNVSDDGLANPEASATVERYDATQIIPLTFSDSDCTQCAFASRVEVDGRDYDQCQAHVLRGGTYHIVTQLFDTENHSRVYVDGILPDFDTRQQLPTFALVRPAVPNTHFGNCAMGASCFDTAIDALQGVDEAYTSFCKHLRLGGPKLFVDQTMVEKDVKPDGKGGTTTTWSAFGEFDDAVYRMRPNAGSASSQLDIVQPDLKVDENTKAINTALNVLSFTCGFGAGYFSWDAHSGLKTATEIVTDNAALARSLKKHQNALAKSIERIVRGYASVMASVAMLPVDPSAELSVELDDGAIVDTETERKIELGDAVTLDSGALKVRYLMRYYGMTEEEAREAVPSAAVEIGL